MSTNDYPAPLALQGLTLAAAAARMGAELRGPDRPLRYLVRMKYPRDEVADVLTYATAAGYVDAFAASAHEALLVERRFLGAGSERALAAGKSLLVCDGLADELFFQFHCDTVAEGRVATLAGFVDPSAHVHPRAVVEAGVRIGARSRVDAGVVLYPNTVIGADVHIMANAVLGGEGFETKVLGGRRILIPHSGGVIVEDGCSVGSAVCIDRGLFGTFTRVRAGARIDNLCHIAHNVDIGEESSIVACSLVAGSVRVGRGVWWGPASLSNHEIVVGDCAYIGSGSVVTRDLPAHALAFGAPAKVKAFACRCRNKVEVVDGAARCDKCGTRLVVDGDGLRVDDGLGSR